ncbi:COesterase domain-containing protein [Mycena kentingensis (nom. inval.)]|nr:COesterase domain-containing protein [Mycena kentingensis (nom. inval.)]
MILEEKLPPPPYSNSRAIAPPAHGWRTFSALPPHLLLQIVYSTFADAPDVAEQRRALYWISRGLRLVNRLLYTTSMNVLRSLYLPLYNDCIRRPYSSDPFPHTSTSSGSESESASPRLGASLQRETATFDLFIALKIRDDSFKDDSELHLESDDSFTDLFNLMQPRSRLEDLFRDAAVEEGVVYLDRPRRRGTNSAGSSAADLRSAAPAPTATILRSAASHAALTQRLSVISASSSTSTSTISSFWKMTFKPSAKSRARPTPTPLPAPAPPMKVTIIPLPFSALSIAFSSRRAGLQLSVPGRTMSSKRTVVEVARGRDEPLEVAARKLVWALRDYLVEEVDGRLY